MSLVQKEESLKQIDLLVDAEILLILEPNIQPYKGRLLGSKKRKGDSSTTRHPSAFEIAEKTRKCGACHHVGHNRRTCPSNGESNSHSPHFVVANQDVTLNMQETPFQCEIRISLGFIKNDSNESDSDENYDTEAMALFTKNFKRFFMKKNNDSDNNDKKGKGKFETSSNKDRKGVKGPPSGPKCYECHGYGHLAQDYANKKAKQKIFSVTTWDDDTDSEKSNSDRDEENNEKTFLAFTANHHKSDMTQQKLGNGGTHDSDNEEEEVKFDELQEAYNNLYEESRKLTKQNDKLASKNEVAVADLSKALSSARELSENLESVTQERNQLKLEL
ncbi:hypothetical protein RHGRI_031265 [Rhododendron griersonianum]|uniref:CCHC-type domain-containing protein n=1 Tax=Rhododendron griersonianum TaxID=479676 RepID=A0AAV6IB33_9ERIC|nr:hypothetical protein RHGRI_031265 [Rhododendron griersonianum]